MSSQPAPQQDELFKHWIAALIASVTLVAAVAAYLQTEASAQATVFSRDAQIYAIQAMGKRVSGQAEVDFGVDGAYYTWLSLETYADSAERFSASQPELEGEARRLRAVRDEIAQLSPLLAEEYFDAAGAESADGNGAYPYYTTYEADRYGVEADVLSEKFQRAADLNNFWSNKANLYVFHLTMLAVALALYGLATTLEGRMRWVFTGLASVIFLATTLALGATYRDKAPVLPDAAIADFARGKGLTAHSEYEQAIAAFGAAIERAPAYGNAYAARGDAYMALEPTDERLRAAIADYDRALEYDPDNTSILWNLSWAHYLLGQYDESVAASEAALRVDPQLFAVGCNQGAAHLAAGDVQRAREAYRRAQQAATDLVQQSRAVGGQPPWSVWWVLDACVTDLDDLLLRLDGQETDNAPPYDRLAHSATVRSEAKRWRDRFKSLNTALEFGVDPEAPRTRAAVSAVRFMREGEDGEPTGEPLETFPSTTDEVVVEFDYRNFGPQMRFDRKVYRDGVEDFRLRVQEIDISELTEEGTATFTITRSYSSFWFEPGLYRVDFFIDGQLVGSGSFTIEPSEG
ncbi:MAG TPA: tetratricopeptide repeat protein [Roseiflexaceae bacterium]|nr:tetratricopeptide repeat protein [Roseiflexaceae bacterium]